MTNKEKMINGKIYNPCDKELRKLANKAHDLCLKYYLTSTNKTKKRDKIIRKIIPDMKENVHIEGPLYVDYGFNVHIGKNFFANHHLTLLDVCSIKIGDNCFFGPNITLSTAMHPLKYEERNIHYIKEKDYYDDDEYAIPIEIGDNCWLASGVIVLAGVKIGSGSVIGAGSVVTHDIPNDSLAYGVPCKVIRKINENDSIKYKKELF